MTTRDAAADKAAQHEEQTPEAETYSAMVSASRRLVVSLLNGADAEESLTAVAEIAHTSADADAAVIFLPSVGEMWIAEITSGEGVADLLGTPLSMADDFGGRFGPGSSIQYEDVNSSPLAGLRDLSTFGPGILSPLSFEGIQQGALLVLRKKGRSPFGLDQVGLTETLAMEVALILKIADGREAQERAAVLEERERISEDLHDLVIQEIFGVGMQLDALRSKAEGYNLPGSESIVQELQATISSLEQAVHQIRGIVYTLNKSDEKETFTERIESETSQARRILGFAPSLVFQMDGFPLEPRDHDTPQKLDDLSERVSKSIADDAIATVREALSNVARHAEAHSTAVAVMIDGKGIIGELMITVIDDGRGLPDTFERMSGLQNMVKRAERHGGSFAFGAGPRGRGTSLAWRVPLEQRPKVTCHPNPFASLRRRPGVQLWGRQATAF